MNQTGATHARRHFARTVGGAMALYAALGARLTYAQEFPGSKPIHLIVPFPAGGGTDIFSRSIANYLSQKLKWVVVVDNKPGAGGNIGIDAVAKAAPDGYTIGMGQTSNLAINQALYSKLPYDPLKDLIPVVLVADSPVVLVVPASSPFKTLADYVAAAKQKPGEVMFGSPGNGTVAHLSGELFQSVAGVKIQHIPYKGSQQAISDLIGGNLQAFASSIPTAMTHIKSGRLRALAVTSSKRAPLLPDTPTIAESGYPNFEAITWFGLVVPAGTPAPIVAQINTEVNRALKVPEVHEKFTTEGGDALGGTPEQFSARLKADYAKWGKVVRESGVKLD